MLLKNRPYFTLLIYDWSVSINPFSPADGETQPGLSRIEIIRRPIDIAKEIPLLITSLPRLVLPLTIPLPAS
jgi:hypothetical protein